MKKTSVSLAALCAAALFAGVNGGYAAAEDQPAKENQKAMRIESKESRPERYNKERFSADTRSVRIVETRSLPMNGVKSDVFDGNYAIKTTKGIRLTTGPQALKGRVYASRDFREERAEHRTHLAPADDNLNENLDNPKQTRQPQRG
jgi:hypothetical protein